MKKVVFFLVLILVIVLSITTTWIILDNQFKSENIKESNEFLIQDNVIGGGKVNINIQPPNMSNEYID